MLKVSNISMDYLECPVGVSSMPEIGWQTESDRKNVIQTHYQIQIAAAGERQPLWYDSGWVKSQQSAHVRIEERLPLLSGKKYYVSVRVRDEVETSAFSEPAAFVTGVLDPREWKAHFISAETAEDKNNSKSTVLTRQIEVTGAISEAYVFTTALGLYEFYINGQKVGNDVLTPGWTSYLNHLCYQTYEITSLLQPGKNTLGALVGAGWFKGEMGFLHRRNNYGERTAFFMQLLIRYGDGREEIHITDESWKGQDGPVCFSEIYDGEIYDARKGTPSIWENPEKGKSVEWVSFPMEALTAQPGARVREMETCPAQKVLVTPKGEIVVDFGQNLAGWVCFRVRGQAGSRARLRCFETLDRDGNVYTQNLRRARQEISYICNGEREETFHPHFTYQGFRYAWIQEWPQEVVKENFTAHVLYSQMKQTGHFQCSDALLNQLHHNILWSLKGNFVDIPTDCPQRDERMGWTGDAQIFSRTACYLTDADPFFRKWLVDVAADQTPDGGVPHVVPDIISGHEGGDWLLSQGTHSAAAWADVAVIMPWNLYLMYGDEQVLRIQYDSMKKWISFMERHARGYIWNYKLQFGDWVALDAEEGSYFGATPNALTCTAYFAYSTKLFAKIAHVLGNEADFQRYSGLYEKILDTFQKTFFQPDGTMTAMTQTAHILALHFQLVPEQYREKTAAALVRLLQEKGGHLVTGFVGTPYFCHALSENGYVREAYALLCREDFPSWLYQVKMGATTIWEHWDGIKPDGSMWSPDMNSFNHYAYGAIGEWMYRVILGIDVTEEAPGWKKVRISPLPGERLEHAQGSFDSIYGPIRVSWEKNRPLHQVTLQISIPPNTKGVLCLEPEAGDVQETGLEFRKKQGRLQADFGSGEWKVTYRIG